MVTVLVGIGVEQGIILAIGLSTLLHVKRHYTPRSWVVVYDGEGRPNEAPPIPGTIAEPGLIVYRFGVGIFFANASHMVEEALALVDSPNPPGRLILQANAVVDVDFTAGESLGELAEELSDRGIVFRGVVSTNQGRFPPAQGTLTTYQRRCGIASRGSIAIFRTASKARVRPRSGIATIPMCLCQDCGLPS